MLIIKNTDFIFNLYDGKGFNIQSFDKNFAEYNFGEATNKIYSFWYYNICDVYIEALKCILSDNSTYPADVKNNTKNVFLYCVEQALIILSPLTPFITEELFQRLPYRNSKAESICQAEFPSDVSYIDDSVEIIQRNRRVRSCNQQKNRVVIHYPEKSLCFFVCERMVKR